MSRLSYKSLDSSFPSSYLVFVQGSENIANMKVNKRFFEYIVWLVYKQLLILLQPKTWYIQTLELAFLMKEHKLELTKTKSF